MNINQKIIFVMLFVFLSTIGLAQTERWVYRYSGVNAYRDDAAYCLVYGSDGNLYAGGYTWNDSTNEDFTVISLTNSGSERWIYKYPNGSAAYSICYSNDGNIYVAGNAMGSDSLSHLTIISLTPGGSERWVYQYPASSFGNVICFGANGNIYAVGDSAGKILVVSVDSNGTENWHYIYPTPSAESDPGRSITYGLDGNIYVAGYSGPTYNTDVTVISLTSSGSEKWVYCYNGPDNYYDYGECVIYGSDGNIYVIGRTCRLVGFYVYWKALAISLTDSGTVHWIYICPIDLTGGASGVYGADGNIYFAGAYGWDLPSFLVISVSDSGTHRWEYIDTTWGYAWSIAYGADGNIYTGGITSNYFLPDTAYFTVISFTPSDSVLWVYRYSRPSQANWNITNSVVYGDDGNIYAAGQTEDSITGGDFTVISLSSIGIQEENYTQNFESLKLQVLPSIIVSRNALLRYTVPEKQHIKLSLYDILGRKVATITEGFVEPGIYSYNFDSGNLSSGIYFLILEGEKENKTQKILVVR